MSETWAAASSASRVQPPHQPQRRASLKVHQAAAVLTNDALICVPAERPVSGMPDTSTTPSSVGGCPGGRPASSAGGLRSRGDSPASGCQDTLSTP
jgi:hypothetical protein